MCKRTGERSKLISGFDTQLSVKEVHVSMCVGDMCVHVFPHVYFCSKCGVECVTAHNWPRLGYMPRC